MADALGLAANILNVIDLFVKVGVQCSAYCAHVKKAPSEVRDILRESDRFTATLKEIQQLLSGPSSAKIKASETCP